LNRRTAAVWDKSGHYLCSVMPTAQTLPESTCGINYFVESGT